MWQGTQVGNASKNEDQGNIGAAGMSSAAHGLILHRTNQLRSKSQYQG